MRAESFLSSLDGKRVLVITHAGADVDALGAAAALYFIFRKKAKITIAVPEHINLHAEALARNLKIPVARSVPDPKKFDRLILLDLNSWKMLGSAARLVKEFRRPILLVDHHSASGERLTTKELTMIDEKAVSTTELIYRLLKKLRVALTPEAACCIAAGIVTDSANFMVADSSTFSIMAEVMQKAKLQYIELVSLFALKQDVSEKIAKLKAARRCRIYRSSDYIIASTDVGAFEAGVASVLVRIAADVAFAGDAERGLAKISGRANNLAVKDTGLDLARDVFDRLAGEFGGDGGGHAAAAAYNGPAKDIRPLLKRCVELAHEFFCRSKKSGGQLKEYT